MKLFKRHKCPPRVEILFRINGQDIIGPIDSESLAIISKYGGYSETELHEYIYTDMLGDNIIGGRIDSVEFFTRYIQ